MLFLSPLVGAYFVHVAQIYFGPDSILLANFSIPLFLCAAMLRPAIFFLREGGTAVEGPEEEVRRLRYQLGTVLDRLEQLEAAQTASASASAPASSLAAISHAASSASSPADLRSLFEEIEARVRKQHTATAERQNRRIAELECSLLELQAMRYPSSSSSSPFPSLLLWLWRLAVDTTAYAARLLLLPLTLTSGFFDRHQRARNKKT